MQNTLLDDALLLVEQNFYFLHVGEFLGTLAKKEKLSNYNLSISKNFGTNSTYHFNQNIIKEVLSEAKKTKEEDITLFEYFVEFNAYRGICMAMVEALRLDSSFRSFMQTKLSEQFEDFFDIVSFVRNVLSHNIHANICLSPKDFDGTVKRIRRMNRETCIFFNFIYTKNLPEISSPDLDYGFTCKVDFQNLKEGMHFLDIISHWELMMLSELCFNVVMAYKMNEE